MRAISGWQILASQGFYRQITRVKLVVHLVIWRQRSCVVRITGLRQITLPWVSSLTSAWWAKDHIKVVQGKTSETRSYSAKLASKSQTYLQAGMNGQPTSSISVFRENRLIGSVTIVGRKSSRSILGLMISVGMPLLIALCNHSMFRTSTWTISMQITWIIKNGKMLKLSRKVRRSFEEILSNNYSRDTITTRMMYRQIYRNPQLINLIETSQIAVKLSIYNSSKSCCRGANRLIQLWDRPCPTTITNMARKVAHNRQPWPSHLITTAANRTKRIRERVEGQLALKLSSKIITTTKRSLKKRLSSDPTESKRTDVRTWTNLNSESLFNFRKPSSQTISLYSQNNHSINPLVAQLTH